MTELEEAMKQQMTFIIFHENRPFCTNEFLRFECNGKEYKPSFGTIRNIFSKFTKKGDIEFSYRDINAYYSLKGHKFGMNSMTVNHTGGNLAISPNHPLYKMLQNMVFDKQGYPQHTLKVRCS